MVDRNALLIVLLLLGMICVPVTSAGSGTIVVTSVPDKVSVQLDDRYIGTTPLKLFGIEPGNHVIRWVKSGYTTYSTNAKIETGKNYTFDAVLKPLTPLPTTKPTTQPTTTPTQSGFGYYLVKCNVESADVYFIDADGWITYGGAIKNGQLTFPVYPTATPLVSYDVFADGYAPFEGTITKYPKSGETVTLTATLTPATPTPTPGGMGYFLVQSNVDGALVYFTDSNGKKEFEGTIEDGELTVAIDPLQTAYNTIDLVADGYINYKSDIGTNPKIGETVTIVANMVPVTPTPGGMGYFLVKSNVENGIVLFYDSSGNSEFMGLTANGQLIVPVDPLNQVYKSIEVVKEGYNVFDTDITQYPKTGETVTVVANLVPLTPTPTITVGGLGYFLIQSNVNGALVYFIDSNGKREFEGTIVNNKLVVAVDPLRSSSLYKKVEVIAAGYKAYNAGITQYPKAGQTVTIVANLTPATPTPTSTPSGIGYYLVKCNVNGAGVFFTDVSGFVTYSGVINNGQLKVPVYVTATPFASYSVAAPGYRVYNGNITTYPKVGEIITLSAQLIPVTPTPTQSNIGFYQVKTNVDQAGVSFTDVNGHVGYVGVTVNGSLLVPVYTTGTPYKLFTVVAQGYIPYSATITTYPTSGQTIILQSNLIPRTPTPTPTISSNIGYLLIKSNVEGANVLLTDVNGALTQAGTIYNGQLNVSVYVTGTPYKSYIVSANGYIPYSGLVTPYPQAGQTVILTGNLSPVTPTPTPTISSNVGYLLFKSNVEGANVLLTDVNGVLTQAGTISNGQLNVSVYVTGTPYTSYIVNANGYIPYSGLVTPYPQAGQTVILTGNLSPVTPTPTPTPVSNIGYLLFKSNVEGANVLLTDVNGVQIQAGTIYNGQLNVSVYVTGTPYKLYSVSANGYIPYSGLVSPYPQAGQTVILTGNLSPITPTPTPTISSNIGYLLIKSNVEGANVTLTDVNGLISQAGAIRSGELNISVYVTATPYKMYGLSSNGYIPFSSNITAYPQAGQTVVLPGNLTPVTPTPTPSSNIGYLLIKSNVEGANVLLTDVNGVLTQPGTIYNGQLNVSVYVTGTPYKLYNVSSSGYIPYSGSITTYPQAGQTIVLPGNLTPLTPTVTPTPPVTPCPVPTGNVTPTLIPGLKPFPNIGCVPSDPDGDGLYEDVNANLKIDPNDVVVYYSNLEWIPKNEPIILFDYNKNGRIEYGDVVALYQKVYSPVTPTVTTTVVTPTPSPTTIIPTTISPTTAPTTTVPTTTVTATPTYQPTVTPTATPITGTGYFNVHSNVEGAFVNFTDRNGITKLMGVISRGILNVSVNLNATPYRDYSVSYPGYQTFASGISRYPLTNETIDLYAPLFPVTPTVTPEKRVAQITVIDYYPEWIGEGSDKQLVIRGEAVNTGTYALANAEVLADFYAKNGEFLGTYSDCVNALNPGEHWKFEIDYLGDTNKVEQASYQVVPGVLTPLNPGRIDLKNQLVINSQSLILPNDTIQKAMVIGNVTNSGPLNVGYANLYAKFYDSENAVTGSYINEVTNLRSGDVWMYKFTDTRNLWELGGNVSLVWGYIS